MTRAHSRRSARSRDCDDNRHEQCRSSCGISHGLWHDAPAREKPESRAVNSEQSGRGTQTPARIAMTRASIVDKQSPRSLIVVRENARARMSSFGVRELGSATLVHSAQRARATAGDRRSSRDVQQSRPCLKASLPRTQREAARTYRQRSTAETVLAGPAGRRLASHEIRWGRCASTQLAQYCRQRRPDVLLPVPRAMPR